MFDPLKTISVGEILGQLNRVKELLREKFSGLYMESLERFIDKIKVFKTHFATLDIRQNHIEHENVITHILKNEKRIKNSLDELSEQDLVSILVHEHFTVHPDQFEEEIYLAITETNVSLHIIIFYYV